MFQKILNRTLLSTALFLLLSVYAGATIVVIAPHPDDAESSCGGMIANAVASGERVIILTMTKGEIGISGKSIKEAANIREEEARQGAAILGAEIEFFGAMDGSLYDDSTNTGKLKDILLRLKPRFVFAPWPLDVHNDHQSSGMLAWRVFMDKALNFELYFYETSNEPNTMSFRFIPTDYIDISLAMDKKREATLKHVSQSASEWFPMYELMASFRGYEANVHYAEGYIKAQNSDGMGGRAAVVKKIFEK
ncbi:MAG: PIG-L family deacetylase [Bacteroidetes bacterium]|nr:PIG-L family deacetylase [Bacteroidota bacterium]